MKPCSRQLKKRALPLLLVGAVLYKWSVTQQQVSPQQKRKGTDGATVDRVGSNWAAEYSGSNVSCGLDCCAALRLSRMHPHLLAAGPGDLPGYTGFRRSHHTLAPFFRLISPAATEVRAGEHLELVLQCQLPAVPVAGMSDEHARACTAGGSALAARIIGPAIIAPTITDLCNGSYKVRATMADAGEYVVELIIEFSTMPETLLSGAPYPGLDPERVHYEGWPLSQVGLPRVIVHPLAAAASKPTMTLPPLPWCRGDALRDLHGRWRVSWRAGMPGPRPPQPSNKGYWHGTIKYGRDWVYAGPPLDQRPDTTLGLRMEWFPYGCQLLRESQLKQLVWLVDSDGGRWEQQMKQRIKEYPTYLHTSYWPHVPIQTYTAQLVCRCICGGVHVCSVFVHT